MRIAFFWTWDFSTSILEFILKYEDIEVVLWVSQIDKIIWKDKTSTHTKLKQFCISNNIPILQPEKLKNNLEFYNHLKNLNLDFLIVVAYWKIIPLEILQIPKYFSINIHWSILPKYRWASPIQESLKNWDKKTWLTIMCMSEWMDEWDILSIKEIDIDIKDKTQDIFDKFQNIWPGLLVDTLRKIIKNEITPIKQDNSKSTYCSKIEKKDWQIDFENEDISKIYNKYRAYHTWPWIYTYYKWKKFDITDCEIEVNDLCYFDEDFNLWDVVEFEDHWENHVWILCKWWILILNKVKLEWKKEMSIKDFLNWNKDFLDYSFWKIAK